MLRAKNDSQIGQVLTNAIVLTQVKHVKLSDCQESEFAALLGPHEMVAVMTRKVSQKMVGLRSRVVRLLILRKIEVGLKTREIAFDDDKSGRSMADAGAPHTGSNSNQSDVQVFDLRWRISGHHWDKTPRCS